MSKVEKPENYVITPEAATVAGCVSYWRVGGDVSIDALGTAWAEAGLDVKLLRKEPEPETALRRAVMEQQERHTLVRALKKQHEWAIVRETVHPVAEGQPAIPPTYTTIAIVAYDEALDYVVSPVHGDPFEVQQIRIDVGAAFHRQKGVLTAQDIATWLVKLAYKNNAVTLRDSGGVYFIPRPAMDFWNQAAAVVETVSRHSHKVFRIPAMKNAEAVEAIIDAVTAEAEQIAKKIEEEVGSGELGSRAYETRKKEIHALLDKVAAYEELVGTQLKVRERMETLQAAVAEAALAASAEPVATTEAA